MLAGGPVSGTKFTISWRKAPGQWEVTVAKDRASWTQRQICNQTGRS